MFSPPHNKQHHLEARMPLWLINVSVNGDGAWLREVKPLVGRLGKQNNNKKNIYLLHICYTKWAKYWFWSLLYLYNAAGTNSRAILRLCTYWFTCDFIIISIINTTWMRKALKCRITVLINLIDLREKFIQVAIGFMINADFCYLSTATSNRLTSSCFSVWRSHRRSQMKRYGRQSPNTGSIISILSGIYI